MNENNLKQRKKILFLALHLGYGGAEKAIVSEANLLAEHHDVEIACAYKLYDNPAFPLDERVRVRYLSEILKPNKEEFKKAIKDKNIVAVFREAIRSIQVLYHRKSSVKKMIQTTDADVLISTRYIFHGLLGKYKKQGTVTIAQEHNHHNNDKRYIRKMIHAVKYIDYFMPVSKELTEFYAKHMPQVKCVYIPHCIDYVPEKLSSVTEPILVSVGRLSEEKGYLELVAVFSALADECPKWQLHIVGDGTERGKIKKAIEKYKLNERVVLHGYQNKEYINQLLAKSSIYVMTSYTESFGIVLVEAQSFGIPCVAYDSARGAMEIIGNEQNGYLIADRDRAEMCAKIKVLMENQALRKQFGRNGRDNALKYTVENIRKQWLAFIDAI